MALFFNVVIDIIVSITMGRCISFVNDLFHSWFCIVGADDFYRRGSLKLRIFINDLFYPFMVFDS